MNTLDDLAAAGFVIDEWARWQQGECGTYALALLAVYPQLRAGVLCDNKHAEVHFFAHDDRFAYDSAGVHSLPYRGVHGNIPAMRLEQDFDWYGLEDDMLEQDLAAASAHIERHKIGPNRFVHV